jgi:hypothetical protein
MFGRPSGGEQLSENDSDAYRYVMIDGRLHMRSPGAVPGPQAVRPPATEAPRDVAATDKPSFLDRLPRLWPKRKPAAEVQTAAPPQMAAGHTRTAVAPRQTPAVAPHTAAVLPPTGQASEAPEKKSLFGRLPKLRAPKWMAFGRSDTETPR